MLLLCNHFLFSSKSWKRLEDVFSIAVFHLPRPFHDVFMTRFPKAISRRLTNTSWKRLEDVFEDKKMLHCRRLQNFFNTSSPKRMFARLWKRRVFTSFHLFTSFHQRYIIIVTCYRYIVTLPNKALPKFKSSQID